MVHAKKKGKQSKIYKVTKYKTNMIYMLTIIVTTVVSRQDNKAKF